MLGEHLNSIYAFPILFQHATHDQEVKLTKAVQHNVEYHTTLPLNQGSATIVHSTVSDDEEYSPTMAWRGNTIICGGTYAFEIEIIKKPSVLFIGWSSIDSVAWHSTVFSLGTDKNCFMLDCASGCLWNAGCLSSVAFKGNMQQNDIFGTVLHFETKRITFYHKRNGIYTLLARYFDTNNNLAMSSIGPLFPTISLFEGEITFHSMNDYEGISPIGFCKDPNQQFVSSFFSTNVPAAEDLASDIYAYKLMNQTYIKYFDGVYNMSEVIHMTKPLLSIFPPDTFVNSRTIEVQDIYHKFFEIFLAPVILSGFEKYIEKKKEITIEDVLKNYHSKTAQERNIEYVVKSILVFFQSGSDIQSLNRHKFYAQNLKTMKRILLQYDDSFGRLIKRYSELNDMFNQGRGLALVWEKIIEAESGKVDFDEFIERKKIDEERPQLVNKQRESLEMITHELKIARNALSDSSIPQSRKVEVVWDLFINWNVIPFEMLEASNQKSTEQIISQVCTLLSSFIPHSDSKWEQQFQDNMSPHFSKNHPVLFYSSIFTLCSAVCATYYYFQK
jgi:hypothetical protein